MRPDDYRVTKLRESITTMRDACNRAEQELLVDTRTPESVIAFVIHELLWGLANANTGIESALSECSRERTRPEADDATL